MEFTLSQLATTGTVAALVAIIAWIGDHRRRKRKNIDAVGFVDWTTIFFVALLLAVLLLGGAARIWLTS
jgi:heme A synthase